MACNTTEDSSIVLKVQHSDACWRHSLTCGTFRDANPLWYRHATFKYTNYESGKLQGSREIQKCLAQIGDKNLSQLIPSCMPWPACGSDRHFVWSVWTRLQQKQWQTAKEDLARVSSEVKSKEAISVPFVATKIHTVSTLRFHLLCSLHARWWNFGQWAMFNVIEAPKIVEVVQLHAVLIHRGIIALSLFSSSHRGSWDNQMILPLCLMNSHNQITMAQKPLLDFPMSFSCFIQPNYQNLSWMAPTVRCTWIRTTEPLRHQLHPSKAFDGVVQSTLALSPAHVTSSPFLLQKPSWHLSALFCFCDALEIRSILVNAVVMSINWNRAMISNFIFATVLKCNLNLWEHMQIDDFKQVWLSNSKTIASWDQCHGQEHKECVHTCKSVKCWYENWRLCYGIKSAVAMKSQGRTPKVEDNNWIGSWGGVWVAMDIHLAHEDQSGSFQPESAS